MTTSNGIPKYQDGGYPECPLRCHIFRYMYQGLDSKQLNKEIRLSAAQFWAISHKQMEYTKNFHEVYTIPGCEWSSAIRPIFIQRTSKITGTADCNKNNGTCHPERHHFQTGKSSHRAPQKPRLRPISQRWV